MQNLHILFQEMEEYIKMLFVYYRNIIILIVQATNVITHNIFIIVVQ